MANPTTSRPSTTPVRPEPREIDVALASKKPSSRRSTSIYGGTSQETESARLDAPGITDTAHRLLRRRRRGPGRLGREHDGGRGTRRSSAGAPHHPGSRHEPASDIHIEPFSDRVRIRYRIDGVCIERDSAPRRLLGAIVSRLKIMGSIDIARNVVPGRRIKIHVAEGYRPAISILPTSPASRRHAILDRENIKVGLKDSGSARTTGRNPALIQAPQRHPPGDRATGFRQDHHPLAPHE